MKAIFDKLLISLDGGMVETDYENNRIVLQLGNKKYQLNLNDYVITKQNNTKTPEIGAEINSDGCIKPMRKHESCTADCGLKKRRERD